MTDNINPLAKHFRHPVIYASLPSGGKWYKPGHLTVPANNVPVMSMTAMDEILVKTPEALLNSTATVEVIKSCVPGITDPGEAPVVDIDKILIAIRIATYGHNMEISSQCPHCQEISDFIVDLRTLVDSIVMPNYNDVIELNGCKVFFRPSTYSEVSKLSYDQFTYEKTMQVLAASETPDVEQFKEITKQIKTAITRSIVINIEKVVTAEGVEVTNPDYIIEFINNISKADTNKIKQHIGALKAQAEPPNIALTCSNEECKKDFTTSIGFDLSRFFV